jgi:capsid protein
MGFWARVFNLDREPTTRELQEQLERQSLKMQNKLLMEMEAGPNWVGNVVDPFDALFDDPSFWLPFGTGDRIPPTLNKTNRGEYLPVYINWYGLKIIRDYNRLLCVFNPWAINAVENRCSYICAKGYQYKLMPKNDNQSAEVLYVCKQGQQVIDNFTSSQNWNEREQEAIKRCDRDGECFIRFFHVGQGVTEARFIEPEWVQSLAERDWETYGVINEPGDVEDVVGYNVIEYPPYQKPVYVPAEEIIHIKLNSDSTTKRGLPTMFPVRKNLERANNILRTMSVLADTQAKFALIRKHKQYSVAAVTAFQQQNSDNQWVNPYNGQNQFSKNYAPGTIIDTGENTDYQFPASTVNAGALTAVLQAELRAIASRLIMPEWMLSSDASNNNYSSTMVAESSSVKNFERLQAFYARRFGDGTLVKVRTSGAIWRVLANAVAFGNLPQETLTLCELLVEGPSLIARDKDKETQRYVVLNEKGVLSKATWSKYEGVDRDQEKKQVTEEQVEDLKQQLITQKAQADAQAKQQQEQMVQQQQAQQAQQDQQGPPPQPMPPLPGPPPEQKNVGGPPAPALPPPGATDLMGNPSGNGPEGVPV